MVVSSNPGVFTNDAGTANIASAAYQLYAVPRPSVRITARSDARAVISSGGSTTAAYIVFTFV